MNAAVEKILLLFLTFTACVSCIKDDNSDCDNRITLRFSFTNHDGGHGDLFDELVNDVSVYIFDDHGYYVDHVSEPRSALHNGNTIYLDLEQGEYNIVAWCNIAEPSYGVGTPDGTRTSYTLNVLESHNNVKDLFYGITNLSVTERPAPREMPLIRNTNLVRVMILGLAEPAGRRLPPTDLSVRITGSNNLYDFENKPIRDNTAVYIPEYSTTYIDGKYVAAASFKVQRLMVGDDVTLNITEGGQVKYSDNVTQRIVSEYEEINTDEDLDRGYEYELFYKFDSVTGGFAFIGNNIKDWDGPQMPGEL